MNPADVMVLEYMRREFKAQNPDLYEYLWRFEHARALDEAARMQERTVHDLQLGYAERLNPS